MNSYNSHTIVLLLYIDIYFYLELTQTLQPVSTNAFPAPATIDPQIMAKLVKQQQVLIILWYVVDEHSSLIFYLFKVMLRAKNSNSPSAVSNAALVPRSLQQQRQVENFTSYLTMAFLMNPFVNILFIYLISLLQLNRYIPIIELSLNSFCLHHS